MERIQDESVTLGQVQDKSLWKTEAMAKRDEWTTKE